MEAYEAGQPMGLLFGTVSAVSPLEIDIDQKFSLQADDLILTSLVRDFSVDMTVDHSTEADAYLVTEHTHPGVAVGSFDSTHKHDYRGRKTFTVHLGLQVGEKVILLRGQGGQQYLVLDRVR